MGRKEKKYMVLDCETATLPFAAKIAGGDAEKKKRIAIARPLIYDIGWTITNRKGNISDRKQYLIAETFAVPSVYNTAYYAEKRPLYLEKIKKGEIAVKPWQEVMEIMIADLDTVDAVGAYNSMFDFKKAIPFTEEYINKLYSPDYNSWEYFQKKLCEKIANERYKKDEDKDDFDGNIFAFRGQEYNLFDLWGLATQHLLNNPTYKKSCLENAMLTATGIYFKTSAESSYRYLTEKYDFDEAHTALEDAIIETYILSEIAKRSAIIPGIEFFPFRILGTTDEFVMRRKYPNVHEVDTVIEAINAYINEKEPSRYTTRLENVIAKLIEYKG